MNNNDWSAESVEDAIDFRISFLQKRTSEDIATLHLLSAINMNKETHQHGITNLSVDVQEQLPNRVDVIFLTTTTDMPMKN